jgi:hypothetical protein
MEKTFNLGKTGIALATGVQRVKTVVETIEAFLHKVSAFLLRGTGIIICIGGICAMVGWLLATLHPDPLGATWGLSIWLVVVGVFALLVGILALSAQYILRVGTVGMYSIIIFMLGALILIAGAFAVNLFVLPWMAKLFAEFPNLGTVLQGGYNTVQNGVNSSTSSAVNTGSNLCNTITNPFGGGNPCSTSSSTTVVPSEQVPALSVNDLLKQIGLPSISTLGTLGLVFLSGVPLAPGCLLIGIVFFCAGVRPRFSLLLLIVAALLSLGCQFLLHLAFLGPFLGILLYLALAWFGFTLWSPWKFPSLEKLLPSLENVEPDRASEPVGQ